MLNLEYVGNTVLLPAPTAYLLVIAVAYVLRESKYLPA